MSGDSNEIKLLKMLKKHNHSLDINIDIDRSSNANIETIVNEVFDMSETEYEDNQKQISNINSKEGWWKLNWCNHGILYTASEIVTAIVFLIFIEEILHSHKCQTGNYDTWILAYHILFYMGSSVCSQIIAYIGDLPSFIGMIFAGLLTGIMTMKIYTEYEAECMNYYFFVIRIALFMIMIICGLKLNIYKLWKIFGTMIKLTLILLIVQTIIFSNVSTVRLNYFKFNKIFFYKIDWWIISSAILVPNILRLKRMGYGKENGIFNLLISEASIIQAVLYILDEFISLFISSRGTDMGNHQLFIYIKKLSITIIVAIIWGAILICVYPWESIKTRNEKVNNTIVTILRILLLCALIIPYELIFTSNNYVLSDVNQSLVCFISSSMASTGWMLLANDQNEETGNNRTSIVDNDDDESQINSIVNIFEYTLDIFQGFYCMGIGYVIGIYIKNLHFTDFRIPLSILIVLTISIMIHIIIITCSVWRSGYNRNEVIFINMAYIYDIPLQTAFSFGILNYIENLSHKKSNLDEYLYIFSNNQLIIVTLVILTIMSYGTKFLSKNVSDKVDIVKK